MPRCPSLRADPSFPGVQDARPRTALVLLLAALSAAGCDFEWGGARVALETPPAREDTAASSSEATPDSLPPLPEGPLLYAVRRAPQGSGALVTPVARLEGGRPAALEWPADPPAAWRDEFRARFLHPGLELPLYSGGRWLGSVIMEAVGEPVNARCPGSARARLLLPPGARVPPWSFAGGSVPAGLLPEEAAVPAEPDRRMLTFGPILAERLLRDAGEDRPYLARPAELAPVPMPGDTLPGMAATYLIGDTLAPAPPASPPATSLFFVAAYREGSGYVPIWSVVESYSEAPAKVVFAHLDWIPGTGEGPDLEILRRVSATDVRLAAAEVDPGSREGRVVWTEGETCRAVARLPGER